MGVTLEQLRVTIAVAEASSFSEAARNLQLTQPAVTRTVRTVEALVGSRLFTRTTRRVELTTDGAEFVAVAQRIVNGYQDGLRRFGAYRQAESGAITIAALTSLAEGILPPVIAEFLRPRPQVEVRVVTGTAPEVMERLRTGQADVAVSEHVEHGDDLRGVALGADRLHAALLNDHPLARLTEATWADLSRFPFVALDKGTSVRQLTDLGFGRSGSKPATAVTCDSIAAASAMVAQGLGASAFPESARVIAANDGLRFIPLADPVVERRLAVITSRTPAPSPLARAFVATLASASPSWPGEAGPPPAHTDHP